MDPCLDGVMSEQTVSGLQQAAYVSRKFPILYRRLLPIVGVLNHADFLDYLDEMSRSYKGIPQSAMVEPYRQCLSISATAHT